MLATRTLLRSCALDPSHTFTRTACITPRIHSRRYSSSPSPPGGSFKIDGNLHTYHERKILPYTQRQLYALVADTDAYQRFIPFVETSKVLKHSGPGKMEDTPWLNDESGSEGDVHKMEHIMRIGFMGFNEEWKSNVTCEKYSKVSAEASPSNLFKVLRTTWTLTPAPSNAPHPSHTLPDAPKPGDEKTKATEPTMVSIDLAYEFSNPFYAKAAGAAFQKVQGRIMGAFEKRVVQVYGEGMQ